MVNRTGNTALGNFTIFYRLVWEGLGYGYNQAERSRRRREEAIQKQHPFKKTMSMLRGELEVANAVRAKYGCTRVAGDIRSCLRPDHIGHCTPFQVLLVLLWGKLEGSLENFEEIWDDMICVLKGSL